MSTRQANMLCISVSIACSIATIVLLVSSEYVSSAYFGMVSLFMFYMSNRV